MFGKLCYVKLNSLTNDKDNDRITIDKTMEAHYADRKRGCSHQRMAEQGF